MDKKIQVMGIINLTDDSYYAPSRMLSAGTAAIVRRAGEMLSEGADILDIGASSSRPGAVPVDAEEEWRRLEAVLPSLREAFPAARLSIDTCRSSVVSRTFDLIGDFIVNDISAGAADPSMLDTAGRLGLTYVAMHMRGVPQTMQSLTDYEDVTASVITYFKDFSIRASEAGLSGWILDPGFGFAKTIEQNYQLLRDLPKLQTFGRPVLVGISRKSMIYKLLNITPEESLPATQALHLYALQRGASFLRVHDVAEARRTVRLYGELGGT